MPTSKRKRAEPASTARQTQDVPDGSEARSLRQTTLAFKRSQQQAGSLLNSRENAVAKTAIKRDGGTEEPEDIFMEIEPEAQPSKDTVPATLPARKRRRPRKAAAMEQLSELRVNDSPHDATLDPEPEPSPPQTRRRAGCANRRKDASSSSSSTAATATVSAHNLATFTISSTTPTSATASSNTNMPCADRNIDYVVLGELCFRTWYPSPYSKDVLGQPSSRPARAHGRKRQAPLLEKFMGNHLYGSVPGRKVYVHPTREGETGEWSVWEVDGEKDSLFCQNLSLFGKLFLDTKSVFYDVHNFNFFLLVYSPATFTPSEATESTMPRITGFFSKEKMSWDNNNLACILVFPPWQRKGLGALLMGVSYEIARREGLLGGPEKPISDLGLKGYRRFWGSEIARWLLSVDATKVATNAQYSASAAASTSNRSNADVLVDIYDCSQATWITPEDCLTTLREMDVVQGDDAGLQSGKSQSQRPRALQSAETLSGTSASSTSVSGHSVPGQESSQDQKQTRYVYISRDAVRDWVVQNKINMDRACDPAGFVEGYAIKKTEGGFVGPGG
ncbi:Males-absent on the first protein [Ceratocystis fimbriata CBS 114723]|uniref:histone acetyltransferase n=1 Tax=Ceratocystis fimbriata CBS 114723 TaxID=1035309 RepID=A0A2C5WVP5_9PEZI|nr:Males-absent on the first protein [Ceratocystis fimbriata CBS 114723]